jgi:putative ABC transport system ATP-binding protein
MGGPPHATSTAAATDAEQDDNATPLVVCEALTRTYTRGREGGGWFRSESESESTAVTAVDSVSLSIAPGEIVGIAGPSGSGKSTLLHLLAGLEQPTGGSIRFEDTELSSLSDRKLTRHRLDNVGIVFQRFHLLPSLSARANVALPLLEQGVAKTTRRDRAASLLGKVGLDDRLGHTPDQLSGGEQQRVAIARALATDPTLIVADEPTGELDSATGRTVLDVLQRITDDGDRSIVVASHDDQTVSICDRVIELADGRRRRTHASDTDSQDRSQGNR